MKTYLIIYGVHMTDGSYHSHETRVRNCLNEAFAKAKLDKYCRSMYPGMDRIEVYRCTEDVASIFDSMFGFNKSNPFNF